MLTPEIVTILKKEERKEVVIVGIETHICVMQTAMGE
jgi:nicotinamidase-related amidase